MTTPAHAPSTPKGKRMTPERLEFIRATAGRYPSVMAQMALECAEEIARVREAGVDAIDEFPPPNNPAGANGPIFEPDQRLQVGRELCAGIPSARPGHRTLQVEIERAGWVALGSPTFRKVVHDLCADGHPLARRLDRPERVTELPTLDNETWARYKGKRVTLIRNGKTYEARHGAWIAVE